MQFPAAFRPPPRAEGMGECPIPSRPPSFPRKASLARVAAEPHCCSEAAEEKAPLNSGGRGPAPGARQKLRPDRGRSGCWRQRAGTLCVFSQSLPRFINFQRRGMSAGGTVGFRKAEMRCLLASSPPLPSDPGLWYRLGAHVASADRVWLWRPGAGCVGGVGGCQHFAN